MVRLDTLQSFRSPTLYTLLGACFIIAGVEVGVRQTLSQALVGWDYWSPSAAAKYTNYFAQKSTGNSPQVLVVGDSSGDHGFSPVTFDSTLELNNFSYNLATLGNFPLAFDSSVNSLILGQPGPFPQYIIAIFTRGGFHDREQQFPTELSILTSPVIRHLDGELTAGHLLHICRLYSARQQLLDLMKGRQLITERALGRKARGGAVSKDGQIQVFTSQNYVLSDKRINVLIEFISLAKQRGIMPIIVHAPTHPLESERWTGEISYNESISRIAAQEEIPFWDYSNDSSYAHDMIDLVHLGDRGAHRFSRELAQRFENTFGLP